MVIGGSSGQVGFATTQPDRGPTDDGRNGEPEDLLAKSADADVLREMIGFAAQRLIEMEVGALTGAGYGDKSAEGLVQRDGYRERA